MQHEQPNERLDSHPVNDDGHNETEFVRTPMHAAAYHETRERHPGVIMIWVESESDKLALLKDPDSPFFTTDRFDGHPSVLVRASSLKEIGKQELTELIQDAWLSRASSRRAERWLAEREM